jgi:hypothetical protein
MRAPTASLLAAIVDYAGTFPPAGLPLAAAMANYGRDRSGPHGALLGRLVLPARTLVSFEEVAPEALAVAAPAPWPLSVIVDEAPSQVEGIRRFNGRWRGQAAVVSVEFPPARASDIPMLADVVRGDAEMFFETPIDENLERSLRAIAAVGGRAKVRTGGTTADAFPSADALARFIRSCADADVPFKATAGLHHAITGDYPLTYDANAPTTEMFGFLNLFLAAALVGGGGTTAQAVDALLERDPDAFRVPLDRARGFLSFGSCSFGEPVDELTKLGLL